MLGLVFLLPVLSIVASYLANRNMLSLITVVLASTAFVVFIGRKRTDRDLLFLAVLWCVALSLLMSETLVSRDIVGYDIHQEFLMFVRVSAQGTWDPTIRHNYDSSLSVSILPLIINLVSDLDGVAVFKFVIPIVFSIVPVLLYKIYRRLLEPEAAFFSVFFLIAYRAFYVEGIALARQEVGEVILLGILLLLLSPKRSRAGVIATIILTSGLVMSHYSLAFIYILVMGLSFCYFCVLKRTPALGNGLAILAGIVLAFSWYTFVTQGTVVISLTTFVTQVSQGIFTDFFNPAARPPTSLALGSGFFHGINRVLLYFVQSILVLGFLGLTRKRDKSVAEKTVYPMIAIGLALIGSLFALPYFSGGLNLTRTYHIASLFAAPCFAYGISCLVSILSKARLFLSPGIPRGITRSHYRGVMAAVLLFSYFLFNSGWVYTMSMDAPTSFILDSQRMMDSPVDSVKISFFGYYTAPEDVAASRWLKYHVPSGGYVCADRISEFGVLASYAELLPRPGSPPTCNSYLDIHNTPYGHQVLQSEAYVYLSVLDWHFGLWPVVEGGEYRSVDLRSLGPIAQNRIYCNGGATIL